MHPNFYQTLSQRDSKKPRKTKHDKKNKSPRVPVWHNTTDDQVAEATIVELATPTHAINNLSASNRKKKKKLLWRTTPQVVGFRGRVFNQLPGKGYLECIFSPTYFRRWQTKPDNKAYNYLALGFQRSHRREIRRTTSDDAIATKPVRGPKDTTEYPRRRNSRKQRENSERSPRTPGRSRESSASSVWPPSISRARRS